MFDRKEYQKNYYQNHKKDFVKSRIRFANNHPNYQAPHKRESRRKYDGKIRTAILILLGNKCSNPNCLVPNGCTDPRCVQIDHIKGKDSYKSKSPLGEYKKILKAIQAGSKDYQLLCANCNWIKRYEKHETRNPLIN